MTLAWGLAWRLMNKERKRSAIALAKVMTKVAPYDPNSWALLDRLYGYIDRDADGEKALRRGLSEFPDAEPLLSDLAARLRAMGRIDEAAAVVDQLIAAHPETRAGRVLAGDLARRSGDMDRAIELYHDAYSRIELPRDRHALLNLAISAYGSLGTRAWARRLLEELAVGCPEECKAPMLLSALVEEVDPNRAEEYRQAGFKVWPGDLASFEKQLQDCRDVFRNIDSESSAA
ncbi:MAG: tetratricopeptide repeat protein [Actinomycetota bacterium]